MTKGRIPDRWMCYEPVGRCIEGTRLIAFKVPLKKVICDSLPPQARFTPQDLIQRISNSGHRLGLIIDLTNTTRYYNQEEFSQAGVEYCKIFTEGHVVPKDSIVRSFTSTIQQFLKCHSEDGLLIGVHCTHGVNRTGYLVCRYMIECLNMAAADALAAYGKARGHTVERENYITDLHKRSEARQTCASRIRFECTEDVLQRPARQHRASHTRFECTEDVLQRPARQPCASHTRFECTEDVLQRPAKAGLKRPGSGRLEIRQSWNESKHRAKPQDSGQPGRNPGHQEIQQSWKESKHRAKRDCPSNGRLDSSQTPRQGGHNDWTHQTRQQASPAQPSKPSSAQTAPSPAIGGLRQTRSHGQAPRSHGQAPRSHGQAPRSHIQAPRSHGQAPRSHGQAPRSHGQAPRSHGQAPRSHGQAPRSHGQAPRSHGQAPMSHGQAPRSHGQAPRSHGQAPKPSMGRGQGVNLGQWGRGPNSQSAWSSFHDSRPYYYD